MLSSDPYFVSFDNRYDLTVNTKPHAGFTMSDTFQCFSKHKLLLTDTTLFATGSTRTWELSDGSIATDSIIEKRFGSGGIYQIQLTVTDSLGCRDTVVKSFEARPAPSAVISSNRNYFCTGDSVTLSTISANGLSYEWFEGIDPLNRNWPYLDVRTTGVYRVKISNGCDSLSAPFTVSERQGPLKPALSLVSSTVLECSPAERYQWYHNGNAIPSSDTIRISVNKDGYYQVKADSGGCGTRSDIIFMNGVGLSVIKKPFEFTAWPNPCRGELHLELTRSERKEISFYDMQGKELKKMNTMESRLTLDMHCYAGTFVLIHVSSGSGSALRKVFFE
jgi:hypothetical protein